MVFCPRLLDNECIFLTGAERFSKHSGYGRSLTFDGDFQDNSPRDDSENLPLFNYYLKFFLKKKTEILLKLLLLWMPLIIEWEGDNFNILTAITSVNYLKHMLDLLLFKVKQNLLLLFLQEIG